ncbi:MarR family transcriptional regulator [Clostridia bacterium]|nr:MarR family transcriptional regulator [Clostridia bacterium]
MLDYKAINQKTLAKELGVADSSLGRLVDRLEKMGLVERCRDTVDRRAFVLKLTEQGQSHIDSLLFVGQSFNNDLIRGISDEDLSIYEEVLEKMVKNVCDSEID